MKKSADEGGGDGTKATPKAKLSPDADGLLNDRDAGLPVWVRAPRRGHEHYTGFTRAKLYELAAEGRIRTCSVRKPGRMRGTRLFHLQSILTFIETLCR